MNAIIFAYDLIVLVCMTLLGIGLVLNKTKVSDVRVSRLHPVSLFISAIGVVFLYLTYEVVMAMVGDYSPGLMFTMFEGVGLLLGGWVAFISLMANSVKVSGREVYGRARLYTRLGFIAVGLALATAGYLAVMA